MALSSACEELDLFVLSPKRTSQTMLERGFNPNLLNLAIHGHAKRETPELHGTAKKRFLDKLNFKQVIRATMPLSNMFAAMAKTKDGKSTKKNATVAKDGKDKRAKAVQEKQKTGR